MFEKAYTFGRRWPRGLMIWLALALLAGGCLPVAASAQATSAPTVGDPTASVPEAAAPVPSTPTTSAQTLAIQAQLAYHDGLTAARHGRATEARAAFNRAATLDPTLAAPHYAAADTWLPFRPDQALAATIRAWQAEALTFRGQHRLAMNAALLLLAVLVGALVGGGALVAFRALGHLQHPVFELAHRRLPVLAAAIAAWIVMAQPLLWGLGFFLTLTLLLGLTWATLTRGERKVAVAAVAVGFLMPLAMAGLSRLAAPFDPDSSPYLLSAASETPGQPGLDEALDRRMAGESGDAALHLARGLVAEASGELHRAEIEYRAGLGLHGSQAALHNNLGNVLQHQGRYDEAEAEYQKAADNDRQAAAPHYNLAQLHARRLQFDRVDKEMKTASRLDFERVRAMSANAAPDHAALMSVGVDARELWRSTWQSKAHPTLGLPALLGWLYGGALAMLPFLTLGLFGGGLALGRQIHRFLPTYSCANCGTVVCRKCLRRLRRRAYCVACGETILTMKTSEFTKMLLQRRLKESGWLREAGHVALQVVVPGWAAVRRGRPLVGLALMGLFMMIIVPFVITGSPVAAVPALAVRPGGSIWVGLGLGLALLYGLSVALLRWLPDPDAALLEAEDDDADEDHAHPSYGRAA